MAYDIEVMKKELNDAIQNVLRRYVTDDYPMGCEFNGELRGIIQSTDHSETGTGWHIAIGDGLPEGWKS